MPVKGSAVRSSSDQKVRSSGQEQPSATLPMLTFKQVLVCTDFSPVSYAAMHAAAAICKLTGAHATMLNVCEDGPIAATTEEAIAYMEQLDAERRRKLRSAASDLAKLNVSVDSLLLDGNAPSVILEEIVRLRADLVVIGTRATRGMERFVFGSTAESVFRKAGCPVLTIGGSVTKTAETLAAGPVLFATDFQDTAKKGLMQAVRLANSCGAALHCIHVLPEDVKKKKSDSTVEAIMREGMQGLIGADRLFKVPPVVKVLYGATVADAVTQYAAEQQARALVLGVRQKSRLASHLAVKRTYRIMTMAPCPVLTVASKREELRGPDAV